jgi:hypothetical protein
MYWYIAMFVLSSIALNKTYVPWKRLFTKSSKNDIPVLSAIPSPTPSKMHFRPKQDNAVRDAEDAQATQEMKLMRGDLDVSPPIERIENPDTEQSPPPPETTEKGTENKLRDESTPIDKKTESQPATANESDEATTSTTIDAIEASKSQEKNQTTPLTEMDIDRLIMTRFLGDTVMALRANQNQMDARASLNTACILRERPRL